MSSQPSTARSPDASLFSALGPLLPFMVATFVGFFATGMALPVVPRHVNEVLGQGTVTIGFVMGCQYIAALLLGRMWAGGMSDARGPRRAAVLGFAGSLGVGALYLASVPFTDEPGVALALVIAARLLTGIAESFVIIAMMAWGLGRMGPQHAGKVFGWMGVALFAGFGAAAPAGMALYGHTGMGGLAIAMMLVALAGLVFTTLQEGVTPSTLPRQSFYKVLGAVKLPGLALTLCSMGYAMIMAFGVLLFAQRGWGGAALVLTFMGAGFIVARLLFGHLPDQVGGARAAFWFVVAEAVGLALIWGAPHPALAWLGAALGGAGYALGFQGFGVEAVRHTPVQSRGAAMGAYIVFQDAAMGLAPPLGGALAKAFGLDAVYLVAAAGALGAAVMAHLLAKDPAASSAPRPR